ncbi:hypothetical protein TRICI_003220 [Trichomonascus ciferrii]|uniref:Uncharacterized protein n=1 Tax=Trichomonascus ciferrii TaxID=44093 RepID=A0A642V3S2_9ASCO|nr:hypothetical protein TRICI_003220 [Trichomonascus ciferrii]
MTFTPPSSRGQPQASGHRRVHSTYEAPRPLVEAANIPKNWKRRTQSHGQLLSGGGGGGDGGGNTPPVTSSELMARLASLEATTRELSSQLELERASKRLGRRDDATSTSSTMLSRRSSRTAASPDVYAPLPGILNEDQVRAKAPLLLAEKLQNKALTARPPARLLIHSTENLGAKLLEIQQCLINACIGYHNWSGQLVHFVSPSMQFLRAWIDPANPWPETCYTLLLCGSVNKNDLHAMRFLRLANTHPREGESLTHFLQRYQRAANDLEGLCSEYHLQTLLNYALGRYPELADTVKSVCCKPRGMDEFFRAYEYLSPIGFYFPKAPPLSALEANLLTN